MSVRSRTVGFILAAWLVALCQTFAAPPDKLGPAITAYESKDYELAGRLLNELVDSATKDPRVYYFRGLVLHAQQQPDAAKADFEEGARLEAASKGGLDVSKTLERIQGPVRLQLEQVRREARHTVALSASGAQKGKALQNLLQQGLTDYFAGRYETARQTFDRLVAEAPADPRVYYFRGLALHQLGNTTEAESDFQRAVQFEIAPSNRIDIDRALAAVQGSARRALEQHRSPVVSELRAAVRQQRLERIGTFEGSEPATTREWPPTATGDPFEAPQAARTAPSRGPSTSRNAAAGSSQPAAINFSFLPPDTEVVVQVRVREIWNSPLVRQLHSQPQVQEFTDQMQQLTGLSPSDIEAIVIGVPAATQTLASAAVDPTAIAAAGVEKQVVVVCRTRSLFDPSAIERAGQHEKVEHQGKTYFRSTATENPLPSVFPADQRTIVLADEPTLQAAIEQGPASEPRPQFEFADASKHLLIVFAPTDPTVLNDAAPAQVESGSKALDRFVAALRGPVRGLALGISVTRNIDLSIRTSVADDEAATELNTAFTALLAEGKTTFATAKKLLPPTIGQFGESFLRTVKSSARQQMFDVSATITEQTIKMAAEGVQEMVPMLMAGMLGGNLQAGPGLPLDAAGIAAPFGTGPEAPKATKPAEGLTVNATARVSADQDIDFTSGKALPAAIELNIDILGEQAKTASAIGFAEIMSATDNNGAALKRRSDPFAQGFQAINRQDVFVSHPQDGCRTRVKFDPPAEAPTQLASVTGVAKLQIIADKQEFVIENVKALLGQELSHADLEAAGYKLKLSEKTEKVGDAEVKMLEIQWLNAKDSAAVQSHASGGGVGLQFPELLAADGTIIAGASGVTIVNTDLRWSIMLNDAIPDDAKLHLVLHKTVDVIDVPFDLKGIPIGPNE